MQIGAIINSQLDGVEYFIVWATELYRATKGLSGTEVNRLFSENSIYELLRDNYFLYHIESSDNFIAEIDRKLSSKQANR